jgi:LIVCS family branched-chain amino acid:cation transporter
MKLRLKSGVLSTGLAMFSMFFGAGNVVFPLALGYLAGDQNIFAITGLLITAVGVPFLGLVAMILFNGDYEAFFNRVGKGWGQFFIILIMTLIGPLVAMPRCVALSYSTLKLYMPGVTLFTFGLIACTIIYLLSIKKGKILDLLGHVLSPLLILFLVIVIVKGFIFHPEAHSTTLSASGLFLHGISEGYNTLDLFASFFFSAVVLVSLRRQVGVIGQSGYKQLGWVSLKAGLVGAGLLGIIYTGFSFIASFYAQKVGSVSPDELLGVLAPHILGGSAGLIANAAVALACLTTAITLAAVFSDFIQKELLIGRIRYSFSLLITVIITFAMANLGFIRLMQIMKPAWFICYPAFIVLSIVNIAYKLYGFKYVKTPVFITLLLSSLQYLW